MPTVLQEGAGVRTVVRTLLESPHLQVGRSAQASEEPAAASFAFAFAPRSSLAEQCHRGSFALFPRLAPLPFHPDGVSYFDAPEPGYESLIGGAGSPANTDIELSRAQYMIDAWSCYRDFLQGMLVESLGRCIASPPDGGSRSRYVELMQALMGPKLDKGKSKGRASRTASPSHDKGKGRTELEDEDKAEDLSALPSENEASTRPGTGSDGPAGPYTFFKFTS